jgi:hypothetical protein
MAKPSDTTTAPAPQHPVLPLDVVTARLRGDASLAASILAAAEAVLEPGEPGDAQLLAMLRDLADALSRDVAALSTTVTALEGDLAAAQHGLAP